MKYELIEVNDDGSGYVVFHLDDGSTVGQQLNNVPTQDPTKLHEYLEVVGGEVLKRVEVKQPSGKVDTRISERIGQKIDITPKERNNARADDNLS